MSDQEPPKKQKTSGAGRDERLSAALRDNLRRRKAQQRARDEQAPANTATPGDDDRDR